MLDRDRLRVFVAGAFAYKSGIVDPKEETGKLKKAVDIGCASYSSTRLGLLESAMEKVIGKRNAGKD